MSLIFPAWLALATTLAAEPAAGTVDAYVGEALAHHPQLAAEQASWQASLERVPSQRALPDPKVTVGGFVQSVETRVGPQQVRLGVQQAVPWPTRLAQMGKAAASDADSAEWLVRASERTVRERVELAYWALWAVREKRALHAEHLTILDGLSATVRARVEVGGASLADLQQVDLSRSRLEDAIATLDAGEAAAVAVLRGAVGSEDLGTASTESEPVLTAAPDTLEAGAHPRLEALSTMAESADHRRRAAASQRLPDFTVGADWIVTGPSPMDGVADSGKDAVAVMVGLRLPIRQGVYTHDVAAARATETSLRERRAAGEDELQAAIDSTAVRLADSARRTEFIEQTLLPQAQAAYEAVLGEYAVGRAQVSQTLLAQRDLLELAVDLTDARSEHQMQWARLTSLTGETP